MRLAMAHPLPNSVPKKWHERCRPRKSCAPPPPPSGSPASETRPIFFLSTGPERKKIAGFGVLGNLGGPKQASGGGRGGTRFAMWPTAPFMPLFRHGICDDPPLPSLMPPLRPPPLTPPHPQPWRSPAAPPPPPANTRPSTPTHPPPPLFAATPYLPRSTTQRPPRESYFP